MVLIIARHICTYLRRTSSSTTLAFMFMSTEYGVHLSIYLVDYWFDS